MIARACFYLDRAMRAATTFVGRLANWTYALHEAFWLGVLDRGDLSTLVTLEYARPPRFLDDDHNRSGLFEWESSVLDREFPDCSRILVTAGGGGREVLGIAERGVGVDGCDPSAALVDSAKRLLSAQGVASQYLRAEPGKVPEQFGAYDGAVVGGGGYPHIPAPSARIDFLRDLATHLRPGSPLLLSFWERRENERRFVITAKLARYMGRLGLAGARVEVGDTLTQGFSHFSTKDELERELAAAGFRMSFHSIYPCGHAVARKQP